MTPQERQLVDDLFGRLANVESTPRDPDALAAIAQGLRSAPNAVYALVQTVLLQDEALKRAHHRIEELEAGGAGEQPQSGGFLDSMRETVFGQSPPRGSVPNVPKPDIAGRPVWNTGQVLQQASSPGQYGQGGYDQGGYDQRGYDQRGYDQPYGGPQPPIGGGSFPGGGGGGGGSFLGTAAAAAAGMVGGSLLLGSIRSMMGGGHHQNFGNSAGLGGGVEDRRPLADQSGSSLARDAGIDNIGSSSGRGGDNSGSRAGLFDQASNDGDDDDDHDSDGFDDDGHDSDYA
jgi:uncharacterized protein